VSGIISDHYAQRNFPQEIRIFLDVKKTICDKNVELYVLLMQPYLAYKKNVIIRNRIKNLQDKITKVCS